ncbi:MAG TPA: zinc ribbon domain-containing protein [Baekduia sp.]|uniref:zinc ribbon domain-containing protein n=1 Tax=Baekduia sp. TaxID=2600305 RepID=UPI002D77BC18|nr:zinc ribbon domain-containing protein [Baekduia sp.]HET6505861.1 zinc ribbon domain-containing protein [Baekduia sp.]
MSNSTNNPTMVKAKALPVAFCPHCGALTATDARFCNACGEQPAPEPPLDRTPTPSPVEPPEPTESTRERSFVAPSSARRRPWLVGAAAAAAVALVGVGLAAFWPTPDHSPEQARASLRLTDASTGQIVQRLGRVHDLHDLRAVGRAAQEQEAVLAAEAARLSPIADKDAGRKALAVIGAERELLAATSLALHVDPAHIDQWPSTRERIEAAGLRLQTTVAAARSLGAPAAIAPPATALAASLQADGHLVTHAKAKLRTWRRAYRRARRAQRRRLAALTSYDSAVSGQLSTYDGLRDDLDDWVSDTGDETIPYGRAFDELNAAADRRKDVRDALAAINPPQPLAAAHASLLAVLSDAIVAMTDAGDAAQECTSDPFCFGDDFRDTPQWRAFNDASRRITGQFAAADQRWEQAVAQMRHSIAHRRMPVAPTV